MKEYLKTAVSVIRESISAIFRGEFLLRLRIDKFFIHIVYSFFLLWMSILLDIRVETTLVELEKSKAALNDIRISHAHKTVQLVSLNRISTVQKMLGDKGSDVSLPEKPAAIIRK